MTTKKHRTLNAKERKSLKQIMKQQGKTQAEFAADLGCSQQMVCKLVNGKASVSVNMAVRLELGTGGRFRARQFYPDLFPEQSSMAA